MRDRKEREWVKESERERERERKSKRERESVEVKVTSSLRRASKEHMAIIPT